MTITDNRQMWQELGINMEQHDILLGALGPIFQEVYLSQQNRPNMGFFDFVVGDIHGSRNHVVFAGGAALNRCLHQLLEKKLGVKLTVPAEPQIIGALGAVLLAK